MHTLLRSVALLSAVASIPGHAAFFRRTSGASGRSSSIALRERLHVNPLITDPGTMEFDWSGAFSTTGNFSLPSTIRYTPEGNHIWWGRTEFSVSFDSLSSIVQDEERTTHFSDRVTFAGACVLHDGARFDFAIAPQATILLRGDDGARLGATAVARYDWGMNSLGATAGWTGATVSSPTNPSGIFDLGVGFGRRLGLHGPLSHLTAHTNWVYERSTGVPRQVSIFEGLEYQITSKVAIDLSGQHYSVWGGSTDHQVAVGLTISTPRLRKGH